MSIVCVPSTWGENVIHVYVTSFLDTPNKVQTAHAHFTNGHHVLSVFITLTNIFYLGALTSFVIKPITVTSPPHLFAM